MVSNADAAAINTFQQSENDEVSFFLSVERLLDSSDALTPLYERETREMLSFYDASLPSNPVYVIWLGEDDILLRLRIKAVNRATLPIEGIQHIYLQLPNKEMIELKMQQVRKTNRDTLDAVCLLESCVFKDVIAQNIASSSYGFFDRVGLPYCEKSKIYIHVILADPCHRTAIFYFTFNYRFQQLSPCQFSVKYKCQE